MNREPVAINTAIAGLLSTGVALVALLVPDLTPALQAAVIAFGNSVILVVYVILTRRQVTPIATPALTQGTTVDVLNQEGEPLGYRAAII